jgi:hypothetical protein
MKVASLVLVLAIGATLTSAQIPILDDAKKTGDSILSGVLTMWLFLFTSALPVCFWLASAKRTDNLGLTSTLRSRVPTGVPA